jgi:ribosomal protein S27AE
VSKAIHLMVGRAVRDGVISKPDACEECGEKKDLHGHHDDYDFPLDVRWLCSACHLRWHRENGPGKNRKEMYVTLALSEAEHQRIKAIAKDEVRTVSKQIHHWVARTLEEQYPEQHLEKEAA